LIGACLHAQAVGRPPSTRAWRTYYLGGRPVHVASRQISSNSPWLRALVAAAAAGAGAALVFLVTALFPRKRESRGSALPPHRAKATPRAGGINGATARSSHRASYAQQGALVSRVGQLLVVHRQAASGPSESIRDGPREAVPADHPGAIAGLGSSPARVSSSATGERPMRATRPATCGDPPPKPDPTTPPHHWPNHLA
jgi:hypothetical protein